MVPVRFSRSLIAACLIAVAAFSAIEAHAADYAIVVSRQTHADPAWSKVVSALQLKHSATIIEHDGQVEKALESLVQSFPRYACFVATPAEAGRDFVAQVQRMTRRLDDDPYTDLRWGILTGFDAPAALRIVETREPLEVRRVASGTELAMDRVVEGVWYCELQKNRMVRKLPQQAARQEIGPDDTTQALADTLTQYHADLFVTSGHATERDWQIGFSYPNGSFRCRDGQLLGVDLQGNEIPIQSENPKVYLPIGNCLMGHVDGPDAMALAFMNSAGVRQMIGYTVPTWYGYAGWGCLDYFVEQPGRYSFQEAFLANQHALIHRLETRFPEIARLDTPPGSFPRVRISLNEWAEQEGLGPQDAAGLLHDRDVLAFYGDPAWDARMAAGKQAFELQLKELESGVFELVIQPLQGQTSYAPVNTNGSQRGGRPFVHFLPHRLNNIQILEGQELSPVITDDFVLVPNPRDAAGTPLLPTDQPLRIRFRGTPIHP